MKKSVVVLAILIAVTSLALFSIANGGGEASNNKQTYRYNLLGAETQGDFRGVIGSISVHDVVIPKGGLRHLVVSLAILDAPITRGGNGIELGWIKCNYAYALDLPCDKPILFAANSIEGFTVDKIKFFPQFQLEYDQDYVVAIVGYGNNIFATWLWWDNKWELLSYVRLPFKKAWARQSWELLGPVFDGIPMTYVGRSQWMYLLEEGRWKLWDDSVPSKIINNGVIFDDSITEKYKTYWEKQYYRWLVKETNP